MGGGEGWGEGREGGVRLESECLYLLHGFGVS